MHPCTGTEVLYRPYGPWGSRGIALPFHDHGTRRGEGSASCPGYSLPRKKKVPLVHKAGWDPGPVWTDAENFASTGIRTPDRPAGGQSLYRLSYPAHIQAYGAKLFVLNNPGSFYLLTCVNLLQDILPNYKEPLYFMNLLLSLS